MQLILYIYKKGCKDCAYTYHKAVEGHGILIRMNVLQMYCFDCKRLVRHIYIFIIKQKSN